MRLRSRVLSSLALLAVAALTLAAVGPTFRIRAALHGGLDLTPSGANVVIRAQVQGLSVPLGPSVAVASWTTDATRLGQLRTGVLQQLTIGAGQLQAQIANGATVLGTFGGILRRTTAGLIEMDATFVVTGGTGMLSQATGSGTLHGVSDPATLAFALVVRGDVSR